MKRHQDKFVVWLDRQIEFHLRRVWASYHNIVSSYEVVSEPLGNGKAKPGCHLFLRTLIGYLCVYSELIEGFQELALS